MQTQNFVVCKTVFLAVVFLMMATQVVGACQCPSCHYASTAQNCQCCIYRQIGKRGFFSPRLLSDLRVPSYSESASSQMSYSDDVTSPVPSLPDYVPFPARSRMTSNAKPVRSDAINAYDVKNSIIGDAIHARMMEIFKQQKESLLSKLTELARDIDNINLSSAMVSTLEGENK